jgi:hypothetical protein
MSALTLAPTPQTTPLKSILLAIILLAAIAAVFYLSPRRTAELTIPNVQIYAARTTTNSQQNGFRIVGQAAETDNDLYVIATVNLQNKLLLPLFIQSINATYTTTDNTVMDAQALNPSDIARLEETFPALAPLMANPLPFDPTIAPGATAKGTVLLHFSGLTEQSWKARKSATLTINLAHQSSQTVTIP